MCPQPPCIRPWANTSVMSEPKSFKETLKEQRALPHPYPNPLYISPRISKPASLGVRPFHDSSSSSVIGGAPCCPWRNETSHRDRSCADTSVIRSPPLVSSSPLNQAKAPRRSLNASLVHARALTLWRRPADLSCHANLIQKHFL